MPQKIMKISAITYCIDEIDCSGEHEKANKASDQLDALLFRIDELELENAKLKATL